MSTPNPLPFWQDFDQQTTTTQAQIESGELPAGHYLVSSATPPATTGEHATVSTSDQPLTTPATDRDRAAQAFLPVQGPHLVTPLGRRVCEPIKGFSPLLPVEVLDAYCEEYLPLVKQRILAQGMPEHLWPSPALARYWVYQVIETGMIPRELIYACPKVGTEKFIDRETPRAPAHPRVERSCDTELQGRQYASYIFADEEWWDGPAHWFACDMQTVLDAYKYLLCARGRTTPEDRAEILAYGKSKRVGRPAGAAKEQKDTTKYWQWVEACRQYNLEIETAKRAYKEEKRQCLAELEEVRTRYEPSLTELDRRVAELIARGSPPRN